MTAIKLDGGGSASLVWDEALANVPREGDGALIVPGRPVPTAVVLLAH